MAEQGLACVTDDDPVFGVVHDIVVDGTALTRDLENGGF